MKVYLSTKWLISSFQNCATIGCDWLVDLVQYFIRLFVQGKNLPIYLILSAPSGAWGDSKGSLVAVSVADCVFYRVGLLDLRPTPTWKTSERYSSGLYPLTCMIWVALLGDFSPTSIALWVTETRMDKYIILEYYN